MGKQKHCRGFYLWLQIAFVGLFALVFFSYSRVKAASLTQGYHIRSTAVIGTVVSSTKNGGSDIAPTTSDNQNQLVGVIVGAKNSIIDLQPKGTDVRVGLSGTVQLLVTDLNGSISKGDYLIISPLSGVAMKDTPEQTALKYIAVANEGFDSKSANVRSIDVKSSDGGSQKTNAGLIQAQLLIQDRPAQTPKQKTNFVLNIADKIAGRKVSLAQVIGSLVVLVTTLLITGLLLNSSIRGSFISLGRNPLSKPAIVNNLMRVLALGLLILVVGIAMAYVILVI